jgi:hypothetical protein
VLFAAMGGCLGARRTRILGSERKGFGTGSLRMADSKQLQQIVERAVAQVLDRQLPKLQAELVERVLAELPAGNDAPAVS